MGSGRSRGHLGTRPTSGNASPETARVGGNVNTSRCPKLPTSAAHVDVAQSNPGVNHASTTRVGAERRAVVINRARCEQQKKRSIMDTDGVTPTAAPTQHCDVAAIRLLQGSTDDAPTTKRTQAAQRDACIHKLDLVGMSTVSTMPVTHRTPQKSFCPSPLCKATS